MYCNPTSTQPSGWRQLWPGPWAQRPWFLLETLKRREQASPIRCSAENHRRRMANGRDAPDTVTTGATVSPALRFRKRSSRSLFHAHGTMSEYGIGRRLRRPALRSPGHGVWRRDNWQDYSFAFTYYRYNGGVFIGSPEGYGGLGIRTKRR